MALFFLANSMVVYARDLRSVALIVHNRTFANKKYLLGFESLQSCNGHGSWVTKYTSVIFVTSTAKDLKIIFNFPCGMLIVNV